MLRLQGLHGSHLAEFVLGLNEAEQLLVALDAGVHDLDGFVKVFQLEIGVRHAVDEGQPCGFPVFHRGLVFPFLRVGGVAELLPQVDLVAHPEFGLVRARGVAVVDVVGRGGGSVRRKRGYKIRGEQACLIQRPVHLDGAQGEVYVPLQRQSHDTVQIRVVVAFPPCGVQAVAGGDVLRRKQIRFQAAHRVVGTAAEPEDEQGGEQSYGVHHSLESASIGLRREAFRAGMNPKTMPMADEQTSASSMEPAE